MKYLYTFAFAAALSVAFGQNAPQSTALSTSEIEEMTWVEAMQDYRVNFHTVVDKFDQFWGDRTYQKGSGWKQFKRWEHFMGQRVSADGVRPNPASLYQTILQQSGEVRYGEWRPMGPYDAPSGDGIGRINFVAFHPNHQDTIYAGAPSGGLWVSYNDGQTWETHTDDLTNIGASGLAIDPLHPDTMYLATGDRDAGDTYSFGLLRSTDGGYTWGTTGLSFNVSGYNRIGRVLVHPVQTNIVIVATNSGIYRSTNYGDSFSLEQSGNFIDLDYGGGGRYFAATNGSNPDIFRSNDFGDTWSTVTSGLPSSGTYRAEVAVAESDTQTVYALFGNSNYGYYGVYRSTNGGTTWTQRSTSPNIMGWSVTGGGGTDGQAWYDMTLAVDPNNAQDVYVGGVNIWRSTNGASTWSIVGHWYGASGTPYVHADHHSADFHSGNGHLYIGTDGGVYKTSNSGSSWVHLNDGMNITQYYKISQSSSDTTAVLAGAQDNGTHLRTGAMAYSRVLGGDGMDNAVDAVNDNYMYGSIYYGSFYVSSNGGNSFNSINSLSPSGSGNWVTPIQADPVTAGTVYTGFTRIWKSTNYGQTWAATSSANIGSGNIENFAIAPSNTNVIYAVNGTSLYKSTNGGQTFSNITPTGGSSPGNNNISNVAIDPNDAQKVAITVSGYASGSKVMVSSNGGATWSNLSSGLPNLPVNCALFDGGTTNGLYVGTDVGIYYRDDNTGGWVNYSKNLPNVIVVDLELYEDNNTLRAGTYGRGIYQGPLYVDLQNPPVAQFSVSPNTTCGLGDTIVLEDQSLGQPYAWKWTILPAGSATFVGGTTDSSQVAKVIFNATGLYSVKLEATNTFGSDDTLWVGSVRVGGIVPPFMEDFESGLDLWTIDNPDASTTWELVAVSGTTPGSNGVMIDHYNYQTAGAQDALISPPFNFSNDTNVELSFEYAKAQYGGTYQDSLIVYASDDCGSTWTALLTWGGTTGSWFTGGIQTSSWSPATSADWCHGSSSTTCPTIDLNAYSGKSGVILKWVAINGYGNNTYLDNINISSDATVAPIANFTGDTSGCSGTLLQMTDLSSNAPSQYQWIFNGGTPSTSTDQNPTVSYATAGTYDVVLIVTNAAGSDTLTKQNFITISQAPVATVSLAQLTAAACQGDSVSFSVASTNGGASPTYKWYVNGAQVSGANGMQFGNVLQNGDQVKVVMTSSEECLQGQQFADSLNVSVSPKPTVNLSALGTICSTEDPILLTNGTPAGGVYSGPGVANNSFDPALVASGAYTITYTYTDPTTGCSNDDSGSILVLSSPAKPTVAQLPTGELEANPPAGSYTFQWLDGALQAISGATASTYMPVSNGDYAVEITSNIQCSNTSDLFSVFNIGWSEEVLNPFTLYPNPATKVLQFKSSEQLLLQVFNAAGQLVHSDELMGSAQLDVEAWARGTYQVQVTRANGESAAYPLVLQ